MAEIVAAETSTNRVVEAAQYEKDVLYIHPSEHSNLALTSMPLDGTNFLAWHRAVYVSLGTEMKLAFIDGSFQCPPVGSTLDCNTEKVCHSISNGPMVYQLQREISTVSQHDISLTVYFTKLMKTWNEITCLAPPPKCR
ncbi:UNVERIFIED_CONTAM: hypothetical protein Sradi_6468800 [Sesamum radiatum]|uniref:Retrotransposon Copia-like N-terminal domain-containing protein n=1 Tax=Sesamum radiatum TaxID=300843 RepID=A0AAW2K5J0_SESRA